MAMNPNMGMANMNPMGGPVGVAPMPMMNNGAVNTQMAAAAAAARQQHDQRGILNTYIYEYFIRYGMYDCARSLLSSGQQLNVHHKDGTKGGNAANGDDPMDTDSKDDLDGKLPDDLPPPKLPMPAPDTSFLYEWFCLFWDIYNAPRTKPGNGIVNQYVSHTQQQNRLKQNQQQQELLRQVRPDFATAMAQQQQYQAQMMRTQNGAMNANMKQGNLARAAMANNQNNPQIMVQQAKQNQMQRDPSGMDQNRERPSSPASGENAPSPSKRPRIDGAPFNPNQHGGMVVGGRPGQAMQGHQIPSNQAIAAAHQMLLQNGINPNNLTQSQLNQFVVAPPASQQKSIATYSQNLNQHHGSQIGNKQVPHAGGPPNQGSPMMAQGPDGPAVNAFYNPDGQMAGPAGIRPGPGGPQAAPGSNHALQDYQMQLMLLEQQNKKRLMMARQEQDTITGLPREGGAPGGPGQPGPNGQSFPEASPQTIRSGASPNPADQMKRGTPQMNNSSISSPVPDAGQSRDSPNPAMSFMGNQVDPGVNTHFFKPGMDGNMAAAQASMNGMRPPSSHPGQPFNGQMNPQQMMAARQLQQGQGQPGQQPGGQGQPGQWQQGGPNGQAPQGMQQNAQVQGTPQQRSMPPPSAPAAAGTNANNRTTASPQQASAAPPTPSQSSKPAPKKQSKAAKEKRAANTKKANQNANNSANAAAGENVGESEAAPATPITPVNPAFNKNSQAGAAGGNAQTTSGAGAAASTVSAPPSQAAPVPPQAHGDPGQNGLMDFNPGMMDFPSMELANPLQTNDVLNDFDFDSFLHDSDVNNEPFDFNSTFTGMEGGEIGAE